jgi:hypothetical protein
MLLETVTSRGKGGLSDARAGFGNEAPHCGQKLASGLTSTPHCGQEIFAPVAVVWDTPICGHNMAATTIVTNKTTFMGCTSRSENLVYHITLRFLSLVTQSARLQTNRAGTPNWKIFATVPALPEP